MSDPVVAAVELGGTKAIAVLARGRDILDERRVPTTTPGGTLPPLAEAVRQWAAARPLAGVGVASFGPVALDPTWPDHGCMLATPKPGWAGADVVGAFRLPGVPLALDTDVNAAALAEGRWGASAGLGTHAYLTIGTGVGLGLVVEGRPVHGRMHPEFGHARVRRVPGDGFAGACPFHGDCAEGLLSGPALAARAGADGAALAPGHPVWAAWTADLAELLALVVLAVAPARIAVGGGVGWGRRDLLPAVADGVRARLAGYLDARLAPAAIIVPAGLGAGAGPLGAVALALAAAGA